MEEIGRKGSGPALADLAQRAMAGETEAFLDLMDAMSDRMYKTAWSILKQEADTADAIQETIIAIYNKLDTLRDAGLFATWATRILINECYRILRRRRPYVDTEDEIVANIPSARDGMEQARFMELLSLADERYHLILTLYYADEYSVREIAAMLEMNENTVKTRLARAREQIRRGLDEEAELSYGS